MNRLKASTDRPAWTQTIFQGRGNGLYAFKHKIVCKGQGNETVLIENYDYTANANAVPAESGKG
jgi:hypothetical protein